MQFKRLENEDFKCYLVGNDLYVKFERNHFHKEIMDLELSSISFVEYDYDEDYNGTVDGIHVIIGVRKEYLNAYDWSLRAEKILDNIPASYDRELLKDIVGIEDADSEDESDYEHTKFFEENEDLEYHKATLIELTLKHARTIAILKKQPGILDLVQTIDQQKQKEGEFKKEISKMEAENKEKDRKIKELEILLQRIPELEKQNKILLEERQTFKQTFFEKVRELVKQ